MSNRKRLTLFGGLVLVSVMGMASAQDLPRSGTIKWHTGWRDVNTTFDVAEGHVQGAGSVVGTTFNETGSGPLHLGEAVCVYTFHLKGDKVVNKGYCEPPRISRRLVCLSQAAVADSSCWR